MKRDRIRVNSIQMVLFFQRGRYGNSDKSRIWMIMV